MVKRGEGGGEEDRVFYNKSRWLDMKVIQSQNTEMIADTWHA